MKLFSAVTFLASATAFAPVLTNVKITTLTSTTLFNDYRDSSAYVGDLPNAYVAPAAADVQSEDAVTFIPPKHHDVMFGNLYTQKQGAAHIQGGSIVDYRQEYEK